MEKSSGAGGDDDCVVDVVGGETTAGEKRVALLLASCEGTDIVGGMVVDVVEGRLVDIVGGDFIWCCFLCFWKSCLEKE